MDGTRAICRADGWWKIGCYCKDPYVEGLLYYCIKQVYINVCIYIYLYLHILGYIIKNEWGEVEELTGHSSNVPSRMMEVGMNSDVSSQKSWMLPEIP